MSTIGTRELKQNPHTVIQHVLETGDNVEITAYGRPTGVHLGPDKPVRQRWVPGARLAEIPPINPDNAAAWRRDIEQALDDDEPRDPWGQA